MTMLTSSQLLFVSFFWILFGSLSGYIAHKKGKDPWLWFTIGMFLGIFGVLFAILMPTKVQENPQPSQPTFSPSLFLPDEPLEWYYLDSARQTQGPIAISRLQELWKNASLTENSFIWSEGMDNWQKIKDNQKIFEFIQAQ